MESIKNKFLLRVFYVSLAIIPFLAFYVAGFGLGIEWNALFFPYIAGKNFAFRILVEIAASAWIMLMLLNKNFRPKKNLLLWVYSIFVFILLLADIFSVNPVRSFFSNFERMEGFITHAHLFLYFLMLITLFKDKVYLNKYKIVLFISNIPVVLLGLLQLLGLPSFSPMKFLPHLRDAIHARFAPTQGGVQLDSSLGNSTYLAIYTIFFIFLFLISYLENRKKENKQNWIYLLMIFLNLVVLFYTQTRGAQVGFAVGIFVSSLIIYFGGRKFKDIQRAKHFSLAIVLVVLVGYLGLVAFGQSSFIKNSSTLNKLAKISSFANPITLPGKVSELKTELYNPNSTYQNLLEVSGDGTFTSRVLNIKMSLEGFKERPVLGWGQDNYFYVFAEHNDPRMYAQEPWFDRSHNVFMDWLIAGGALGLVSYLALYVAALLVMWSKKFKSKNESSADFIEKALLTGLLVAYFVHNIFVFDNVVSYILFFIVLAYIAVKFGKSTREEKTLTENKNLERIRKIIYGPIIFLGLILALYFLNIRYLEANRDIIRGLVPNVKESSNVVEALNTSLAYFKRASQIGGIAEMESKEQLVQSTLSLIDQVRQAQIPYSEEYAPVYKVVSDYIDASKSEYDTLLKKKLDPRSVSIYAAFLTQIGDSAGALKYAQLAYNLAPEKQTITSVYIKALLLAENYEEANQVAEKMYNEDTSYALAKNTLAVTEIYVKKFTEAEKLLANQEGSVQVDENIMQAYLTIGAGERLVTVLEKNIKIDPQDTNSYLALANLYLSLKSNNLAISTLIALKKVSPEMSTTIDSYIEKIKEQK